MPHDPLRDTVDWWDEAEVTEDSELLDPNDPRVLRLLKGLVERDGDDKLDEVEEVQDAQGLDEGGEALGGDIAKSRESGTAESDIKKRSKRSKVCS